MKQIGVIESSQGRKVNLDWSVTYEMETKIDTIWWWVCQIEGFSFANSFRGVFYSYKTL